MTVGSDVGEAHRAMNTRPGKTIDQMIAGVRAGHRMAGMEASAEAEDLARRMLAGELTGDEAVRRAIEAARVRHATLKNQSRKGL